METGAIEESPESVACGDMGLMDFLNCLQKPCAKDASGFRTVSTAPAADLHFRRGTERNLLKDARSSAVRADFGNRCTMVRRARGTETRQSSSSSARLSESSAAGDVVVSGMRIAVCSV